MSKRIRRKLGFYSIDLNLPDVPKRISNIRFGITSSSSIKGRVVHSRVSYLKKLDEVRNYKEIKFPLYKQLLELEVAVGRDSFESYLCDSKNHTFLKVQFEETAKVLEKAFVALVKDLNPLEESVNFTDGNFLLIGHDKQIIDFRDYALSNQIDSCESLLRLVYLLKSSNEKFTNADSEITYFLDSVKKEVKSMKNQKEGEGTFEFVITGSLTGKPTSEGNVTRITVRDVDAKGKNGTGNKVHELYSSVLKENGIPAKKGQHFFADRNYLRDRKTDKGSPTRQYKLKNFRMSSSLSSGADTVVEAYQVNALAVKPNAQSRLDKLRKQRELNAKLAVEAESLIEKQLEMAKAEEAELRAIIEDGKSITK